MQTFLPFSSFEESARVLDFRRLGKQRIECLQILIALNNPNYGWQNHPAVKMWKNHTKWLAKYGLTICTEWIGRGYNDTCYNKIFKFYNPDNSAINWMGKKPKFIGNEKFHASHRAALLFKNAEYYKQFNWKESPELNYIWLVK